MSVELAEIVSVLSKKKESPFVYALFKSLCAERIVPATSNAEELRGEPDGSAQESRVHSPISELPPPPPMSSHTNNPEEFLSPSHSQSPKATQNPSIEPTGAKGEFEQVFRMAYKELPDEKFKEIIFNAVESYYGKRYNELSFRSRRCTSQLRVASNIALILLIGGVLVIFVGAIFGLVLRPSFSLSTYAVIIVIGVVCEIIGILTFCLRLELINKLEESVKKLNTLIRIRAARLYISQIANPMRQDKLLKELLSNILEQETK